MRVEPHGMPGPQDLDAALADDLAKLPFGYPVMRSDFRYGQRPITGGEKKH